MTTRRRDGVYTIPPSVPFLPALVEALFDGRLVEGFNPASDPLALADVTLYLPTRRAARAVVPLIRDRLGGTASLMPSIRPLGDVEEDLQLLTGGPFLEGLPSAISGMERLFAMTRLVGAWEGAMRREVLNLPEGAVLRAPASAADAAWLAGDLVALMDEMETEEVSWQGLATLVPEDHARYWQITLDFLKIAMEHWPAYLGERGAMDPKARRSELIRREARRLRDAPPRGPVIAAGATGSIPATAELLATISQLEKGAVVLPGFEREMDERSWAALVGAEEGRGGPSHPQYGMARLVGTLGLERGDVLPLVSSDKAEDALRDRLVAEALRPAETTDAWPSVMGAVSREAVKAAFAGVDLVVARNEADEALAVATFLRQAVEEGKTGALVTPDRTLARRVAVELTRWGLQADDSAGRPLDQTAPGVLARLASSLALDGLEPVALLALLKHPLTRLGLPANNIRASARALERAVLRGPRSRAGTAGLREAVAAVRDLARGGEPRRMPRWQALHDDDWDDVADLVDRLADALAPLERHTGMRDPVDVSVLVADLEEVLRRLARDEEGDSSELYAGEAGEGLAAAFSEMLAAKPAGLQVPPVDWPAVFVALVSGINIRRRLPGDPRIAIFGPMEARLQAFDTVILGALNEGSWPQSTRNDPWLNRPMKGGLGLDPPERRIGAAAHDFTQALGARHVVLSRAERSGGAPTVASRWLLRLTTLLGRDVSAAMRARGAVLLSLAGRIDQVTGEPEPAPRPQPSPPVAARPRRISVTEVETLIRDPYAIYARKVLVLDPVEPVGGDPGAAEKGTLIHDCLAEFLADWNRPLDDTALARLIEIGRARFASLDAFPAVRAVWWLRFERIAEAFIRHEQGVSANIAGRHLEIGGALDLDLSPGGAVTLSARADRIDVLKDGTLAVIDYKTGQAPSDKEVASLLAPQLPLEAAMIAGGAFTGIDRQAPVSDIAYLRLSGGRPPLEWKPRAPKERSVEELASEALARTRILFAGYENPEKGYLSRARVRKESELGGSYDHLARVREWSLDGSVEE
ncbi:double-strand break repair protein AddB [Stappia sp. MMSF_3263]|uniref:double-strand break repair protein AddB n=1 Tax=Stappia sp. MMSF_3263 TaxID=3046693 RepID=UPI00273E09E2|nr:double-strand break repair protein AddB [Stappia sp. MMSF_3263]